ncbi:hypothetical protein [Micromonospora sp. NBRC 101691]|uniref:hypothetical protein n=1 Tax=Micromonospora sp. NBRC 101691 TaxID=3032198 RepID=UPI0024A01F06|nr:hypothetical protein [Micromonospora sp. NBRC 101691]GLY20943.1 hypothetical protein Misp04_06750 [Micromonospora sp. NBRC 101691]
MTDQQPGPDQASAPPQPGPDHTVAPQPDADHGVVPQQAPGPAMPPGFVPTDGPFPPGGPAPGPLAAYRVPLVAAGAVVALLLAGVVGTAIYQAVKEDSGITACKAMAAGSEGKETLGDGDDELSEAEYRELREQFADSDHEKIREHGTALVDIVWEVSRMKGDEAAGALAYIGPMSTHMTGLKTACANEGVQINLN